MCIRDSLGTTVVIRHSGGYVTTYSSLSEETAVAAGDTVSCGDTIGTVGKTALTEKALEPHVHFSVTCNDKGLDPAEFVGSFQSAHSIFFIFFLLKGRLSPRRTVRGTAERAFPRGNRLGDFFALGFHCRKGAGGTADGKRLHNSRWYSKADSWGSAIYCD